MTYHLRQGDAFIHSAVEDMEIRPADAAIRDIQPHFALAGRDNMTLAQIKRTISDVIGCVHKWNSSVMLSVCSPTVGEPSGLEKCSPLKRMGSLVVLMERPLPRVTVWSMSRAA